MVASVPTTGYPPMLSLPLDGRCSTPTRGHGHFGDSSPIGDALLARKRAREARTRQPESSPETSPVGASLLARKRAWAFQAGRSSTFSEPDSSPGSPVEVGPAPHFAA